MPYLEVVYAEKGGGPDADAVDRFGRQALGIFQEVCGVRPDQLRMAVLDVPFENTLEPVREEQR